MFQNKNVDGILCIREGYGCTQILILIEYDLIQSNPKPLIGISDVTALLYSIYKRTGLITFHGPVGSTFDDNFPKKDCIDAIRKPEEEIIIQNAKRTKEHR
jgi:muramoyltetrapeptide carboxypeptidase